MNDVLLYEYWRSSAAYRVRIALNLKGIAYRSHSVDLVSGEQHGGEYRAVNPQGFVPALVIDGELLTQSLAIIDYLDALAPAPRCLPEEPLARARVLGQALVIAADIHPLNNSRVLTYLRKELGLGEEGVTRWYQRWIAEGFAVLEQQAPETGWFGGADANLADICLVPQMYNARRFGQDLSLFPRLVRIDEGLRQLPAFAAAAPDAVRPA